MKEICEVIQDLIPLVNDGVASEESIQLVHEHCQHCPTCSSYSTKHIVLDEENLNRKWKKKLRYSRFGFIALLVLLACSFTATSRMFQNFYFIPMIGILGYALLGRKVYNLYLVVFITQCILELFQPKLGRSIIFYVLIYWLLLSIGILIYRLYYYALKGEKS